MLNRVYSILDRRRRPLRNCVYLAFPDHNLAYARITEPAFRALRPILFRLAGGGQMDMADRSIAPFTDCSERFLFHGNVELLTARELKRRYPDMKVVAWVQDPLHRLAYCYEKIILNSDPLPTYYAERYFDKSMTPQDFVSHIALISDLEADNLFRSQTAALTYKGELTADTVLKLEQFEQSLDRFLSEISLENRPFSSTPYRISDYVSYSTLRAFCKDGLRSKLKRRYKSDYRLFYSPEVVVA